MCQDQKRMDIVKKRDEENVDGRVTVGIPLHALQNHRSCSLSFSFPDASFKRVSEKKQNNNYNEFKTRNKH